MGGKNYKKLMEFLKETGHFIESEADLPHQDSHTYKRVSFSPDTFAKLALHSWLSGKPRANFYANEREIFYQNGTQRKMELTPAQKEDIIREDEILRLLGEIPADPTRLYGEVDGHLRLDNFNYSGQNAHPKKYDTYLEEISYDVPANIIRKDERIQIGKRIKRHSENLSRLFAALKADRKSLPNICRLEETLAKYEYQNKK